MTLLRLRTVATQFGAAVLACLSMSPVATQAQAQDAGSSNNMFVSPYGSAASAPGARSGGTSRFDSGDLSRDPLQSGLRNDTADTQQQLDRNGQPIQRPSDRSRQRPLPPSAFQKFVETSTGRRLPVFGSRFFEDASDTFLPVDNVPVSSDYTVGPGDEILVRAWGSIDVDYRAKVDRNGQINLPRVGSFTVAGVRSSDLERQLRGQIGRLYTNFNLAVTLGQLRGVKVFVVGPARLPGVYTLSSQSTVLSAVVAAGGPGPNGSMRKVQLRRDDKVVSELDIYDFLVQGDKSKDVQLNAGDVIVFTPVGPRVALTGALETPGIYELKAAQEPVADVLRYAGGAPVLANPNRVHLERIDPTKQPAARSVEDFKLDPAGQQKPMRDGDLLTLLDISPQFSNAVTLKGHVAQPLRYPFTPGMRIRDLIPDKDALISPDFFRRKNMLVQMADENDGWRSDRLRQQDRLRDPFRDRNADEPYGEPGYNDGRSRAGAVDDRRAEQNAALSQSSRRNADGTRAGRADDIRDGARTGWGGGANGNAAGRLDDRDGRSRSGRDSAERERTPAPLFDEINWDYAVIERLNDADLTTQVIPFNLGKAVLAGDASANVELKPGDVVTVYSQRDVKVPVAKQTRLVSIEGEVGSPGVYQLQPGETLQQLVTRAGGFTPQAYIFGLELTREETRRKQRENLAAAIARLESLVAAQSARDAANQRELNSAQANAAANNAQLTRLTRLDPNGRIALELDPSTSAVTQLPVLPLENGDRVTVPTRPGFVTVAGAVVNSNSFLWRSDRSAGDYLGVAGMDETADKRNIFILRADGTVEHANSRRGFLGLGGIETAKLNPGDAIVVPSQVDFETWGRALVRNLKDWSQIFSQFGLGIAAINTLKND